MNKDAKAMRESGLDLPVFKKGKVREVYDLGDKLLLVASDRISAFDVVFEEGIPDKGIILTQISSFWFDFFKDVPSHFITNKVEEFPAECQPFADKLKGRATLGHKAELVEIECVVRGYLAGSGWKEYKDSGTVCGHELPAGLEESDKLPEPIFTPATKAASGHDENISVAKMNEIIGEELGNKLMERSISMYKRAADYAAERGIIIADTKFEFGKKGEELIVIDEMLTPDSSRFWPQAEYKPGGAQPSFDKQFLRDYLETLDWDKSPPPPPLPDDIRKGTRERYAQAYELITGKKFEL